jgi:hypothetical protein
MLSAFITLIVLVSIMGTNVTASFSSSSTLKFALNIITIIVIAAIIFRVLTHSNLYKDSPLMQLIINCIFYIPCLLVSLIDNIVKITGIGAPSVDANGKVKETTFTKPTTTDYILLVIAILLNVGYFVYPYVAVNFAKQGGNLLINNPIYTNNQQVLGNYATLNSNSTPDFNETYNNGGLPFNYNFAISFWVFIDAASPSTSNAYTKYTSLLSYGNKPNVLYRGMDNTLMITMQSNKPVPESLMDENGNRIIYVYKNVLLQKWNNIIINYNGGTLDIFLNGELVKSAIEVVPFMSYDPLTVGSPNGIRGGICSVNFFNKTLNIQQIYYLYNFLKDYTPPVFKSSEETITNIATNVPTTLNTSNFLNYTNTLTDKFKNQ